MKGIYYMYSGLAPGDVRKKKKTKFAFIFI